MRAELAAYVLWYEQHRPHQGLEGKTPAEVREGTETARERGALEVRKRMPLARARGDPRRRRCRRPLELVVTHVRGRAHLPIVALREVA
jgi:hypothetical protein